MKPLAEVILESNQAGVELLITDTKLAHTFLDLAETAEVAEDRARRIREAHHAYQTILSFLARVSPTDEQAQILGASLNTLRTRLRTAGLTVD